MYMCGEVVVCGRDLVGVSIGFSEDFAAKDIPESRSDSEPWRDRAEAQIWWSGGVACPGRASSRMIGSPFGVCVKSDDEEITAVVMTRAVL